MVDSQTAERAPVYDFDFIRDHALLENCHDRYWQIKSEAPPIFWTNANGGHWVCNDGQIALDLLQKPNAVSSRYLSIPPNPNQQRLIPEMLDPPEHKTYRDVLRPFFALKEIAHLQDRVNDWANRLLGEVAPAGQCEFVSAVATRLPIAVFMELFGFPMEKFDEFRHLVIKALDSRQPEDVRIRVMQEVRGHLDKLIHDRQAEPRNDMISKIVASEIEGRPLKHEELMSISYLMFLAGLETVTNAMSFGMRHLAHDEKLRQTIIDDPEQVPDLVEELLRRYAFVATPRYLAEDLDIDGVRLHAGDSILIPLMHVGWDAKQNPEPEAMVLDRKYRRHAAFGFGVHTCLGIHLARMEMITFYRTWFRRIGHFRQLRAEDTRTRGGSVMAIEELYLEWDA